MGGWATTAGHIRFCIQGQESQVHRNGRAGILEKRHLRIQRIKRGLFLAIDLHFERDQILELITKTSLSLNLCCEAELQIPTIEGILLSDILIPELPLPDLPLFPALFI